MTRAGRWLSMVAVLLALAAPAVAGQSGRKSAGLPKFDRTLDSDSTTVIGPGGGADPAAVKALCTRRVSGRVSPARVARVEISGGTAEPGASVVTVKRTLTTGADGTFGFKALPPGRYTLSATSDDGVRGDVSLEVAADPVQDVVISLRRGLVISGFVRDAAGQPRPGVTVVDRPDVAEVFLSGSDDAPIAIELLPWASVSGRVVRAGSGAALAGAVVFVRALGPSGRVEAATDAAGRFVLDRVSAGPAEVCAEGPPGRPAGAPPDPRVPCRKATLTPGPNDLGTLEVPE